MYIITRTCSGSLCSVRIAGEWGANRERGAVSEMGNTTKATVHHKNEERREGEVWVEGCPAHPHPLPGGRQLNTEQTTKCRHVGKWKMNATVRRPSGNQEGAVRE